MLKNIIVIILVSMGLGSLSAQTFIGNINPYPGPSSVDLSKTDTVKILAVLVDFQEDKDAATFGNGKFGSIYSKNYGNTILDPLPHDQAYFEEHLEFVKNYFEKVSNRKLIVTYTVLPKVITVSQRMRVYSPPNNSNDFSSLGAFSKEVWAKADSAYPGFDFAKYNLFTIFHAGVGRDVSLPGSIGDQRDLPSVYLGLNAFKKIYGNSFNGFPVSNNSFDISNTMIIPETESREMDTYGGTVLFQITINGLLVASVASHLGLPDLFDTKTGNSAIGRFGLMDGQSIFAYNGIFPPEPSAWEKIRLGWEKPVTLSPGKYSVDLACQIAATQSDTTILKVPINSSEYFLIENRIRDAHHDGAIVTYVLGGDTLKKTFYSDTTGGFSNSQVDSVQGVVTNIDEFDWALPGNGIVIWHIDDNIINSKIADNQINADINHRGIYVEEADGIWDIGQIFTDIFGDKIVGDGAPEDFWYKSNPSKFFQDRFADDTQPNSKSNSGANSLITISNFSDISNKMSFDVAYGDSIIKPIFANPLNLPANNYKLNAVQIGNDFEFSLATNSSISQINNKGDLVPTPSIPTNSVVDFKTSSVSSNGVTYIVAGYDSTLYYRISGITTNLNGSINIHGLITSAPVIQNTASAIKVLIGTKNGLVKSYSLNGVQAPQFLNDDNRAEGKIEVDAITVDGDYYAFAGQSSDASSGVLLFDNSGNQYQSNNTGKLLQLALTVGQNGDMNSILLLTNNTFKVVDKDKLLHQFQISSTGTIGSFGLADLKQNGQNYIIFTNDKKLEAVNLNGSEADNFPFADPEGTGFTGNPLAADFAGDNKSEIIAATFDGRIFAIDGGTGKVVPGFPISAGSELGSTPVLFEDNGIISLAAINDSSDFYAWKIGTTSGNMFWTEESGNSQSTAFVPAAAKENIVNQFFPKDRAYNYPNPVYGNETNIRYYVSEDSKIDIKIFDISGDFVAELHNNATGGMDNETKWNVSNIQSGVYLARIEAQGVSGKTESNIIKIAVVK